MSDATLEVDAGVCRFKTVVIASMDENMDITYKIKSECPSVREVCKKIGPQSVFDILAKPFCDNVIYKGCQDLEHVSCPVPCAMIKAAEAAGELALKKDVSFKYKQ